MEKELKKIWQPFFSFNWKFGLFLVLAVCIPRFILVLNANETSNYSFIGLVMTISAIAPFAFLSKYGRKAIGLTKPANFSWLVLSFIIGLVFSLLLYLLGELMYKDSIANWYVYIGNSYNIPANIQPDDKLILFAIMASTGMIFSPIGEELFFRGIIHSSFAKSVGNQKASVVDGSAFAITHLSHFGLVFVNNGWKFLPLPALLWILSMFGVSLVFYWCRKKTGSILGAILCHAAFNLGMIYCIFYFLN